MFVVDGFKGGSNMANKIKNAIDWYYQRLVKDPCKQTYDDYKDKYEELSDLIFKMWQNDLISDKVKIECYEALGEYSTLTIKYLGKF
jgi:hypothetical protein